MNNDSYAIGTVGTAAKDLEALSGKIQKGDRVQIIDIDDAKISRGYALLDLDTGVKLIETGFDSIIPARCGEIVFDIGTTGIASRDISAILGKIKKGDRVKIIDVDTSRAPRGYELLDLDTGVRLIETGFDSIIPDVEEKDMTMEHKSL